MTSRKPSKPARNTQAIRDGQDSSFDGEARRRLVHPAMYAPPALSTMSLSPPVGNNGESVSGSPAPFGAPECQFPGVFYSGWTKINGVAADGHREVLISDIEATWPDEITAPWGREGWRPASCADVPDALLESLFCDRLAMLDPPVEDSFSGSEEITKAYPPQYVEAYARRTLPEPEEPEKEGSTSSYAMSIPRSPRRWRLSPMGAVALAGVGGFAIALAITHVGGGAAADVKSRDSAAEIGCYGPSTSAPQTSATILERARNGDMLSVELLARKPPNALSSEDVIALVQGTAASKRALIRELGRRIDEDPTLVTKPKTIEALRLAVAATETAVDALRVIANLPGTTSADWLYEVWTGSLVSSSATKRLAERLLSLPEAKSKMSPALSVAVELRRAKGCEEIASVLPRVIAQGDQRSLGPLGKLMRKGGCGLYKKQDCFPCLRRSRLLEQALKSVNRRHPRNPSAQKVQEE